MCDYTAVIRTLGLAGIKYQQLLNSLCSQSILPRKIIVYIAEGYEKPKETCGIEEYYFVKKGMVAQRALPYKEVETEYILFLDDDVYLPPKAVENLFNYLEIEKADVISPDTFHNHERPLRAELSMTLSGRMKARRFDKKYGYKVLRTAGYSYNKKPIKPTYISQTNAGPCFLCRKSDFLKINFHEELWMDRMGYAIGDDQVMFYKMHLYGLKQLTHYKSGIKHLDAGNNLGNKDKEKKLVEGDYFFKLVFWHRFIYLPETNIFKRILSKLAIGYWKYFGLLVSLLKGEKDIYRVKRKGISKAKEFLLSQEYQELPKILKTNGN